MREVLTTLLKYVLKQILPPKGINRKYANAFRLFDRQNMEAKGMGIP